MFSSLGKDAFRYATFIIYHPAGGWVHPSPRFWLLVGQMNKSGKQTYMLSGWAKADAVEDNEQEWHIVLFNI